MATKRKQEFEELRSLCLYDDEVLTVRYTGKATNFPKDRLIKARPRFSKKSDLPYPQPKWTACDYYIEDLDGHTFCVAKDRFGKLSTGFEWEIEKETL